MIEKLLRAAVISAAATAAIVWVLRRSEAREDAAMKPAALPEVDADSLDAAERDALVAELEAQL